MYHEGEHVLRTVAPIAADDFEHARTSGLIDDLVGRGALVGTHVVDREALGELARDAAFVLEHERIPFLSYPYEWGFEALKAAAMLHLDVQLRALSCGVALSDATAYNVQFVGARPMFIDPLSFRRYREGEFWLAHRQFCEQFLNPLLLRALVGVTPNAWLRGSIEGIPATDLVRLLPRRRWLSRNVLVHVVLQARFQRDAGGDDGSSVARAVGGAALPRASFERLLAGLRRWIESLSPADRASTPWQDYEASRGYATEEVEAKRAFVRSWAARVRPALVCDVGCNAGEFSEAALDGGAGYAVGLETDPGALDAAFSRAADRGLRFLPLSIDAANPSPSQGFEERERPGLAARLPADGILALGVVHHLAIGRNVPLARVVDWIVDSGRSGVIEHVPKDDPMVARLLRLREDVFADYDEETLRRALERRARIERVETITTTGRRLYEFTRD